jgi:Isochorismatase family
MKHVQRLRRCAIALATVLAVHGGISSARGDIISEWANVKPPPVPELKPAVVDSKTTALLILDLMKANCGQRPRCLATVPNVKKLHDDARAAGLMVFYTLVGGPNPTPVDVVDPGIAPRESEWVVQRGPDKFLGSPLEERLKAHGIRR